VVQVTPVEDFSIETEDSDAVQATPAEDFSIDTGDSQASGSDDDLRIVDDD